MAELVAIITKFDQSPQVSAQFDVSVDTRAAPDGSDVFFQVTDSRGQLLAQFVIKTRNGFASSATAPAPNNNLFALSQGRPACVRASVPQGATNTTARLIQQSPANRLVIAIPPLRDQMDNAVAEGKIFPICNGDVTASAILVANVSGTDTTVDVFIGTVGAAGAGKYSIPRLTNNSIGRIDLAAGDANCHLVIASTGDIVAQLVIDDDGKLNGITCIPKGLGPNL